MSSYIKIHENLVKQNQVPESETSNQFRSKEDSQTMQWVGFLF